MPSGAESNESLSQVYLLCLWRETLTSPWRASLRAAGQDGRVPFPDLETLARYLLAVPERLGETLGTGGTSDDASARHEADK